MIKLLLLLCLFNYKIFSYFIAIPFLVLVMRHPKMIEMFTVFCSVMARIKKNEVLSFFWAQNYLFERHSSLFSTCCA